MNFLPVGIQVFRRTIVIIGGGRVAVQKLRLLTRTAAHIRVYARSVCGEIRAMGCLWEERPYDSSLITGAFLVYACTDDHKVNRQIAADARAAGVLVNVADDPDNSDFISPAVWTRDPMSVAVSSDGTDARRSIAWRDAIRQWGEHDSALR